MKDDIFERFIKSIAIMFGCFLLLYCMIVSTQKHPRGIALKIVMFTEFVTKGLFYIAIGAGVLFFAVALIENIMAKKRIKKEEKKRIEREKHNELMYLKQEIENLKRQLEEAHDEKRKIVQAFHQEQAHRVEFENHLKNRTPQAAGVPIPKRHWSKNLLEHDHKLISLRLNLETSGIAHSWIPEHKIRANIFRSNDFRTAKEKLIPDGLMATEADKKRLSVAIELELTLKNKDKLRKTLSRYRRQDGILGVWYIAPTKSLLNSISAVWNDIGASSSGNKLYLSVFEDVIKNPLNAKVFGHGRGLVTSELWTPRPAHPSAQSVSKQDENREHSLSELSPENHAPNYQDTG